MKRTVSVILALVLILSAVAIHAAAETTMLQAVREGAVFVVRYHHPDYPTEGVSEAEANENHIAATGLMSQQIAALTYCELYRFGYNTLYIGLPYAAVDAVAALPYVDSVSLYDEQPDAATPAELDEDTAAALAKLSDEDAVNLALVLRYQPLIYHGFGEDDYKNPDDYIAAKRACDKAYYTEQNLRFYERIASQAELTLNEIGKYTPIIYVTARRRYSRAALAERSRRYPADRGAAAASTDRKH